jgi:DNA replication licensing factor MCM2
LLLTLAVDLGIYTNRFDASLNMKNGFPVFATLIEANYIMNSDDEKAHHFTTEEEREVFAELATRPNVFSRLVDSIAPSIHGHKDIKTALLLSMYISRAANHLCHVASFVSQARRCGKGREG